MKVLVTGSAGHLGEALVQTLRARGEDVVGLDLVASRSTSNVGSITDRSHVKRSMKGVDAVLHTATLHKPHFATHPRRNFVDTNITATLTLLKKPASPSVAAFVFTRRTSVFAPAWTPA